MAYSESLARRVREVLSATEGVSERKMFGGIAFLVTGNMCCGVSGDELMVRLGQECAERCLKEPHTREMDFTGKLIKSMLFVKPAGIQTKRALAKWVHRAVDFVSCLPPK